MKYRARSFDVEAMQYYSRSADCIEDILDWMDSGMLGWHRGGWELMTPVGPALLRVGDWIVRYELGKFWRVPPDDFVKEYEPVEGAPCHT